MILGKMKISKNRISEIGHRIFNCWSKIEWIVSRITIVKIIFRPLRALAHITHQTNAYLGIDSYLWAYFLAASTFLVLPYIARMDFPFTLVRIKSWCRNCKQYSTFFLFELPKCKETAAWLGEHCDSTCLKRSLCWALTPAFTERKDTYISSSWKIDTVFL